MTIKFNLGGNATPATSSTGADAKPAAPAAPSRFVLPAGHQRPREVEVGQLRDAHRRSPTYEVRSTRRQE